LPAEADGAKIVPAFVGRFEVTAFTALQPHAIVYKCT
jgi:hypothetical protein